MKRRDFLKLIGVAVTAPTALAAMPKKELTIAAIREFIKTADLSQPEWIFISSTPTGYDYFYEMYCENESIGTTMMDIPKDMYRWVRIVAYNGTTKTATVC